MSAHRDEWGRDLGYCNSCGEESLLDEECCEDGEVIECDDADEEATP